MNPAHGGRYTGSPTVAFIRWHYRDPPARFIIEQ